jgi:hypothetical protein
MRSWKKQKTFAKRQKKTSKKLCMKKLKVLFPLLIPGILFLLLNLKLVSAQTMTNDDYILKMGNFNMAAGKPTGSGYELSYTAGQTAPGLYSGLNYKVRAGFQYIYTLIPFTFTISNTNIDFGTLTATNPVTRTNTLTISNGSANGYQVTASENHALLIPAYGQTIPDTTCDNGLCTPSSSAEWSSSLAYGFGYRCDNVSGTDCATGFTTPNYYKPFVASPSAEIVMTGANVGRNKQCQITYKVNVSGTQAAGTYTNTIMYIATPTF